MESDDLQERNLVKGLVCQVSREKSIARTVPVNHKEYGKDLEKINLSLIDILVTTRISTLMLIISVFSFP